ncbi:MAG TPA: ArsA family ATPase [Methylomirabilota bacterium]|nr:ArsA family ATPase [Methylomirabilota bacterium]
MSRRGTPCLQFFAGKGGVGKTTCAAATALAAAERGARVVVISTDPAHSLGDAVGRALGPAPRRVPVRAGALDAVELDADRALARWLARRRRTLASIAERGTYLDDEDLERLLRLSFPGVDELMALVELARLGGRGGYELVVVDTAPTGHALRLLAMPRTLQRIASVLNDLYAKHRFLADSLGGGYRADAADRLIAELDADGRRLSALLRDPSRCRFTWLLLPETLALEETRDGIAALAAGGIRVGELVANRVTPAPGAACALCEGRRAAEARVLAETRRAFPDLPLRELPALEGEPYGVPALRSVARLLRGRTVAPPANRGVSRGAPAGRHPPVKPAGASAAAWLGRVAPAGVRLLVFAGKGGVGKTTCATAAALALARGRPGARVLLLSADPAHSLGDALGANLGDDERAVAGAPAGLRARELDADRALARTRERYRRAVEDTFDSLLSGSRFDVAYDREALHGLMDLAPPGLDELFAVLSLVEALVERQPPHDVVVLDTAPTGHALRLLEMPATALAWVHALLAILLKYREVVGLGEVAAELVATARRLRELSALLADAGRTRVVAVTRAAALPERETGRLLARLARLHVAVPAVLVNALTAGACPRCRRVRRVEQRMLAALRRRRATRRRPWSIISTPALAPPPRGVAGLERWTRSWELDE